MKYLFLVMMGLMLANPVFSQENQSHFEKLFPILTAPVKGREITPKTTQELENLFPSDKKTLPRIFVKKLPDDFKEKGNKELFSKVIAALVLRENEQILSEKVLFNTLKQKFEQGKTWTPEEAKYFDYLVKKYDATVLKTIPTKINDLVYKIDEIPLSVAVAQAAQRTDWGKENLDSPYAQKGWKDSKHYDFINYPDLYTATTAYVNEMNATPNYDDWRYLRMGRANKDYPQYAVKIAQTLGVYLPDDVFYTDKLQKLLKKNSFLFRYDNLMFDD